MILWQLPENKLQAGIFSHDQPICPTLAHKKGRFMRPFLCYQIPARSTSGDTTI